MADEYQENDLVFPSDARDSDQMQPFNPAAGSGLSWWESTIQYGVTKAIDNRLGRPNTSGNTSSGSFGGANGATYNNGNQATGASATAASGGGAASFLKSPTGMLAVGGALVLGFLALRS